jgi:glycosyltransferase involved in cell wall biosynthesis
VVIVDFRRSSRPGPCGGERYRALLRVAVVVSGWPRVSETFALNELLALHERGMLAAVFATKAGDPSLRQPGSETLDPFVTVLPDVSADEQARIAADLLAAEGVHAVHGYFAHQPAEVAQLAAGRLGVPFGFSVHALDVRKVAPSVLRDRAAAAAVVVACNHDAARTLVANGSAPVLLPHGVDTRRFVWRERSCTGDVRVLAVGRLVPKKGFDVLIDAFARLDRPAELRIVGEGPERARLEARAARLGLSGVGGSSGVVRFDGRRTHAELPELYAESDIVAVPSVVDLNGDRDGLPNVVLEAMASGCAVVASDVAAIGAAVHHGENGLLVPPNDPSALAAALGALVDSPLRRRRFGLAARTTIEADYGLADCASRFCDALEGHYV